jgi:hypothetical protein
MSECRGRIAVTTKVDAEMRDRLENEAERIGVYRSEVIRRLLDTYAESADGELNCPNCGCELHIEP